VVFSIIEEKEPPPRTSGAPLPRRLLSTPLRGVLRSASAQAGDGAASAAGNTIIQRYDAGTKQLKRLDIGMAPGQLVAAAPRLLPPLLENVIGGPFNSEVQQAC